MARRVKPELSGRVAATQATLNRFVGRAFAYGSADCVHMAAYHLRKMGHQVLLSKGGRYRSALGAAKALKRAGYDSLAAALDGIGLERIAPAAAIVGDIISVPDTDGRECLMVVLGNGRALGWVDDVPAASVVQPLMYQNGWRVAWLKR